MIWKGGLSLVDDELTPASKYPAIDLDKFALAVKQKIFSLPIIERLGFSYDKENYGELRPLKPKIKGTPFYEICFIGNSRKIKLHLSPTAGGYYEVYIARSGGKAGDLIALSRYFELHDKDSPDRKCVDLHNFPGLLEEQVEESLNCINRILEERFEGVLKGEEWMDVPSSFYDYK